MFLQIGDTTDVGIRQWQTINNQGGKNLPGGLKIKHHKVSLYAPSKTDMVSGFEIGSVLFQMSLDYRRTPHSTTNISPFKTMFGRNMKIITCICPRER